MFRILELNKSEVGSLFLLVLFLVVCESIRFFRLKFLWVKLDSRAEKTGCSRRLSFWLPDRFSSVNYATPARPLPLPSAPLLKKVALLKFQFDLVVDEEPGTLFRDYTTV